MGQKSKPGQNKRVVNLPIDKHDDVLSKHFSKTYPNGFHGYRGASYNNKSIFINPQKIKRVSKGTSNLYYVLMDNLPAYRDYPKRSKSIIFSNHKRDAEDYVDDLSGGKVYKVFPNNRAKIAVAQSLYQYIYLPYMESKTDIRTADEFDIYITDSLIKIYLISKISDWKDWDFKNDSSSKSRNDILDKAFSSMSADKYKFPSSVFHDDTTAMNFLNFIGNYISSNFEKIHFTIKYDVDFGYNQYFGPRVLKFMNYLKDKDLLVVLKDLFDPIKNNIKLMNVDEAYVYAKDSNNRLEMWTDGLCYLVETESEY